MSLLGAVYAMLHSQSLHDYGQRPVCVCVCMWVCVCGMCVGTCCGYVCVCVFVCVCAWRGRVECLISFSRAGTQGIEG